MSELQTAISSREIAKIIDEMPEGKDKHFMKEFFVHFMIEKVERAFLFERLKDVNIYFDVTM